MAPESKFNLHNINSNNDYLNIKNLGMNTFYNENQKKIFNHIEYSGVKTSAFTIGKSLSNLSTTEGGERNRYNNRNPNENLENKITKAIKDVSNFCLHENMKNNSLSLACAYYCDINFNINVQQFLETRINNLINNNENEKWI